MFQNWLHWFGKLNLKYMQLYVIAEDRYIQGKYSTLNETKFKVISFKYKKVDPKGRKCIVY